MIEVKSPMPASVYEVLVSKGEAVKEGQELIILESMKMEIPVEAPAAGTVEEICVEAGASVNEGDVLIRIAP